jgi:shikimate dehydrogenase
LKTEISFALGLIGWPLQGSLSPRLHKAALNALGLAGEYKLYPVPPLPEGKALLIELLWRLQHGELQGLNVTIPYKQAVLPLLDELTPIAQAIGAVNTISCRDGKLVGYNTDAPGFLADLKRVAPELFPPGSRCALVMGAGGAGRAVVYALARDGWEVTVADVRQGQAQSLAAELGKLYGRVNALPFETFSLAQPFDLLVNATPVGMTPDEQSTPWPVEVPFPPGVVVYDVVYKPPVTLLVRSARSAGLKAANGLGMLVEQAALAFEAWTGRSASREAMWKEVS